MHLLVYIQNSSEKGLATEVADVTTRSVLCISVFNFGLYKMAATEKSKPIVTSFFFVYYSVCKHACRTIT